VGERPKEREQKNENDFLIRFSLLENLIYRRMTFEEQKEARCGLRSGERLQKLLAES
jgi:hypothetical protein